MKKYAEKMTEKLEIIGLNIINLNKFKLESLERFDRLEK